jgi:hypothetical protein
MEKKETIKGIKTFDSTLASSSLYRPTYLDRRDASSYTFSHGVME